MSTATRSKGKTTVDMIDPKQWRVTGQLTHAGITYGTAEPLPRLTLEEAERYEKQGTLERRTDMTLAESYLEGPDAAVLQSVLEREPAPEVLDQMIRLAQRNSRSKILELALMIAAKGAGRAARPDR